jgi:putative endonuclease
MRWHVYLVRCRDGSLYCGIASDVADRVARHNAGRGARYIVPSRRPVECVWRRAVADKSRALSLEYWVKRLKAEEKRALAGGEFVVRSGRQRRWSLAPRKPRAPAGPRPVAPG